MLAVRKQLAIGLLLLTLFLIQSGVECKQKQRRNRDNTNTKAILLYHVTSTESIKIIDKSRRVSFLDGHSSVLDLQNPEQSKLPNLYTLLYSSDTHVLVGTREKILNVTLDTLALNEQLNEIDWKSVNSYGRQCPESTSNKLLFGCHNYITAAIPLNSGALIICGTNSSQPFCRRYSPQLELQYEFNQPQFSALSRINPNNFQDVQQTAPFSVDNNSIYFINSGSYTIEPTINKQTLHEDHGRFGTLVKTPKGALKNARFRASFTHGDKVYFFFYETESAIDVKSGLTFKTPFSQLGQVCKNDNGKGSYLENINRFVTFQKALIYCYLPDYKDGFHVKYTEIQAVSEPVLLSNQEEAFYAIFTFRRLNSVDSALCQYKMTDVHEIMSGSFKSSEHNDRIQYKRPLASCDEYPRLDDQELKRYYNDRAQNYNFQMEETVNEPALFALNNVKFTAIAVDPPSRRNNFNEVVLIGLEDGRVLKVLMRAAAELNDQGQVAKPVIVQEYHLFRRTPVNSILLRQGKLIAMSDEQVRSIELDAECGQAASCGQCVNAQDPYCAWSLHKSACVKLVSVFGDAVESLIPIANGSHKQSCFNLTGNANDALYELINEDSLELKESFDSISYDDDDDVYFSQYSKSIKAQEPGSGNLLVAIFLTALLTCLLSVALTCLLINKRYKMADYLSRNLSTTLSSNRSTSSSTTSYNNYKVDNKFLSDDSRTKLKNQKHYQNFYEASLKPLLDKKLFGKKSSMAANEIAETDMMADKTMSSSDCAPHYLSAPKSINNTLSSSNDSYCFDPHSLSDDGHYSPNLNINGNQRSKTKSSGDVARIDSNV